MNITEEKRDDKLIVNLSGRLDAKTSKEAEKKLLSFVADGETKLLLDCGSLEYISSAGIRVVLMLVKKLKQAGGRLVFASLQNTVKEVFDLTNLTPLLEICGSRDEGLESFGA